MSGAIWSASLARIRAFPAKSPLRFLANHGQISLDGRPRWRTVDGGSKVYVEKLTAAFSHRARLGCPVRRVSRDGGRVVIDDGRGERRSYDAAMLACHADQALSLLASPTKAEQAILGALTIRPTGNPAFRPEPHAQTPGGMVELELSGIRHQCNG